MRRRARAAPGMRLLCRLALRAWSRGGSGYEGKVELLAHGCGFEHRGIVVRVVAHATTLGAHAVALAEHVEEARESLAIAVACMMAACIGRAIACGEMWELLLDEGKVALARLVLQAEGAGADVRRAGLGHALHERFEIRRIVGDAGEHGHAVDPRVDAGFAEPRERADARLGGGRARL